MAEVPTPRHGRGPGGERRGGAAEGTWEHPRAGDEARLEEWSDRLRAEAARARRRRERWLRQQVIDATTIASVLQVHAERTSRVAITTLAGGSYLGRVREASTAVVVVETPGGRVLVDLDCIGTLRSLPEPGETPVSPSDDRSPGDATTMGELLALAVWERPEVRLVTRSGEEVGGELVGVGRDVALVQPPGSGPLVYSPIASLSEAVLVRSAASG